MVAETAAEPGVATAPLLNCYLRCADKFRPSGKPAFFSSSVFAQTESNPIVVILHSLY